MLSSRTMLMFKPDCLSGLSSSGLRCLLNEAVEIGLEVSGWHLEMGVRVHLTQDMAARLYAAHKDKPFYGGLMDSVTCGPSFVSVWSCNGSPAWQVGRDIVGRIRKAHGRDNLADPANLVHSSDGSESAEAEVQWAIKCFILRCAEEG